MPKALTIECCVCRNTCPDISLSYSRLPNPSDPKLLALVEKQTIIIKIVNECARDGNRRLTPIFTVIQRWNINFSKVE